MNVAEEKYFKIFYHQIEKIEVTKVNIELEEYYNFALYCSQGLIKITISKPEEAQEMIYSIINNKTNSNQNYYCPNCKNAIVYGQQRCSVCGQLFDWNRL